MMAVRILLKSCATPPASWPTACILVAWATCFLSRVSSLLSLRLKSTAASPRPRTPGEAERHRLVRLHAQAHLDVAGHLRADGVAADCIGDSRLILGHDEIPGIARPPFGDARRAAERFVVEKKRPSRSAIPRPNGKSESSVST